MKYYLLVFSNLFMLNVARILLFFKCKKIPNIIIKQCEINNKYIEEGL